LRWPVASDSLWPPTASALVSAQRAQQRRLPVGRGAETSQRHARLADWLAGGGSASCLAVWLSRCLAVWPSAHRRPGMGVADWLRRCPVGAVLVSVFSSSDTIPVAVALQRKGPSASSPISLRPLHAPMFPPCGAPQIYTQPFPFPHVPIAPSPSSGSVPFGSFHWPPRRLFASLTISASS
jgi:hypothetical protein